MEPHVHWRCCLIVIVAGLYVGWQTAAAKACFEGSPRKPGGQTSSWWRRGQGRKPVYRQPVGKTRRHRCSCCSCCCWNREGLKQPLCSLAKAVQPYRGRRPMTAGSLGWLLCWGSLGRRRQRCCCAAVPDLAACFSPAVATRREFQHP